MPNQSDNSASEPAQNLFVRVMRDFRAALTTPNVFFAELDYDGPLLEPFTFHLMVSVVNALGTFLVANWAVNQLLVGFLWTFVGGFLASGFFYLAGKLFSSDGTFLHLYRGVAFAMAPLLFGWIPLMLVICYVYALFLLHKVVSAVLQLDEKRTNIVIGAFVALFALIALGSAFYSLTKIFGTKSNPAL